MSIEKLMKQFAIRPDSRVSLKKDHDPGYVDEDLTREEAAGRLREGIQALAEMQDKLYAQDEYAVLVIFQAMDAAGKDGTIKHVTSGINPQGCQVYPFKAPSEEELDHDYLWRCAKVLPERGRIGIFNRSYYEEVLVARVHPEVLDRQKLPPECKSKEIWKQRFRQINHFERHLVENGTVIIKFFLNVSKKEQKKRFLERIEEPEKNWKFSARDVDERAKWNEYMEAFEDVFNHTSTEAAPWYIIPADTKWFTRATVAGILCARLAELKLRYPSISPEARKELARAKRRLLGE